MTTLSNDAGAETRNAWSIFVALLLPHFTFIIIASSRSPPDAWEMDLPLLSKGHTGALSPHWGFRVQWAAEALSNYHRAHKTSRPPIIISRVRWLLFSGDRMPFSGAGLHRLPKLHRLYTTQITQIQSAIPNPENYNTDECNAERNNIRQKSLSKKIE